MSNTATKIDRTIPFDVVNFTEDGFKILEEDQRSLNLHELDVSSIVLKNPLTEEESEIQGEEWMERLNNDQSIVLLDANIFSHLWNNQHLIPESWKEKASNRKSIFFPGTLMSHPNNDHKYGMFLSWDDGWKYEYDTTYLRFSKGISAAVIYQ